jgi:hypothetical protein
LNELKQISQKEKKWWTDLLNYCERISLNVFRNEWDITIENIKEIFEAMFKINDIAIFKRHDKWIYWKIIWNHIDDEKIENISKFDDKIWNWNISLESKWNNNYLVIWDNIIYINWKIKLKKDEIWKLLNIISPSISLIDQKIYTQKI